jgi:3-dehydroquinate synthetase
MDRLAGLCGSLHGQTRAVEVTETELRTHLSFDKKRRLGRPVWVLPRAIGRVAVYDDITAREIHEAIRFLRDWVKR